LSYSSKGFVLLSTLFNSLLRLGYFPVKWKIATIILIKKPGKDKTNPDSYRPISLLTSLSKIFEIVIHTRLLDYLNITDAIPKFQFGFRSNHSTVQQLLRITEHINSAFEMHCHTGAIFIDILKAFDKVWHEGLFFKLRNINTPSYLFNIIHSFFLNRQYSVRINDSASNLKPMLVYLKVQNLVLFYSTYTFSTSLNHHEHKLLSSLMTQPYSRNHATSKQ